MLDTFFALSGSQKHLSTKMQAASTTRRFANNFVLLFGSSVVNSATSLLFIAFAAQRLGVEDFGKYSTVQIFVTLFAVLTDIGLMNMTIREVAQNKELTKYIAGNVLAMKTGLGLLAFVAAVISAAILGYEPYTQRLIAIYSLTLIATSVSYACNAIFSGHEKMVFTTITYAGGALWSLIGIVSIALGYGLTSVFIIILLISVLSAITSLVVLRVRFKVKRFLIVDKQLWRRYIVGGIPFGISSVISMIAVSIGPIMLSRTTGETTGEVAVGYYNVAFKVISVLILIIGAYNAVVYPVFSRLQASSEMKMHQGYELSTKIMMLVGFSSAAGLTVVAGKIVGLIFPGYEPAIPVLQILAWFVFFSLLSTVTFNVLYAGSRQGEVAVIIALAAGASLIVNWITIPFLSVTGTGLALVVFTAVQYALSYRKLLHKYPVNIWQTVFRAMLVALVVALVGVMFQSWNLFILMFIMGSAFLVMIPITRIFESGDLKVLANLPGLSYVMPKITKI